MDENSTADKVAYFRSVAARLRAVAEELRYDPRRRNQLHALADGFERHAERFERGDIG